MKAVFLSQSPKETKALAGIFLSRFGGFDKPLILALSGNLGAGKTTFIQGLAKTLDIKDRVNSPTFVVMKSFVIPRSATSFVQDFGRSKKASRGKPDVSRFAKRGKPRKESSVPRDKRFLWHIDCWRLQQADFEYLGLKEILKNPENIVCLEWADRVKKLLPDNAILFKFEHAGENKRTISISNS